MSKAIDNADIDLGCFFCGKSTPEDSDLKFCIDMNTTVHLGCLDAKLNEDSAHEEANAIKRSLQKYGDYPK